MRHHPDKLKSAISESDEMSQARLAKITGEDRALLRYHFSHDAFEIKENKLIFYRETSREFDLSNATAKEKHFFDQFTQG